MKVIRLLYPDYVSGGLDTYYFGANLLAHILPQNNNQPLYKVEITPPGIKEFRETDGIYAKEEVISGIKNATSILESVKPDKVITIGGNCMVSLAPFDYLHGIYEKTGIIWIDSHPDVSVPENGYPNAHAMVLGSLLKNGDETLNELVKNNGFKADEILYVGLQPIHDYQEKFLKDLGVDFKIQDKEFISLTEIRDFIRRFDHILIHLDIDVLDPAFFHSTYFANENLVGDGSGAGKMTMKELSQILKTISEESDIVGFTIAEYLPFDEFELHKMLSALPIFTG